MKREDILMVILFVLFVLWMIMNYVSMVHVEFQSFADMLCGAWLTALIMVVVDITKKQIDTE